ncbi:unnamed protein product [Meganyctiphanes norvegica]|uniref:Uncharacterized protein n=1 Tax=Meganyctiphanes norvegica TaxID=48144 RepID=A0AAV2S6V7_MEGNR
MAPNRRVIQCTRAMNKDMAPEQSLPPSRISSRFPARFIYRPSSFRGHHQDTSPYEKCHREISPSVYHHDTSLFGNQRLEMSPSVYHQDTSPFGNHRLEISPSVFHQDTSLFGNHCLEISPSVYQQDISPIGKHPLEISQSVYHQDTSPLRKQHQRDMTTSVYHQATSPLEKHYLEISPTVYHQDTSSLRKQHQRDMPPSSKHNQVTSPGDITWGRMMKIIYAIEKEALKLPEELTSPVYLLRCACKIKCQHEAIEFDYCPSIYLPFCLSSDELTNLVNDGGCGFEIATVCEECDNDLLCGISKYI